MPPKSIRRPKAAPKAGALARGRRVGNRLRRPAGAPVEGEPGKKLKDVGVGEWLASGLVGSYWDSKVAAQGTQSETLLRYLGSA